MTTTEWIALGQMLTGMLGIGLVWLGLQQMRRSGDQREKREDARHREAMRGLDALIKGMDQQGEAMRAVIKGMDQQGETLRAVVKGMDQQGEALRAVVKGMDHQAEALKVVVERTAPRQ